MTNDIMIKNKPQSCSTVKINKRLFLDQVEGRKREALEEIDT